MIDTKTNGDTFNYGGFHSGSGMMLMDCCIAHATSKEHFQTKKKMLEEKIKWVNKELAKK